MINNIFNELQQMNTDSLKSPRKLLKDITDFLCSLEPRGFLACLGVRKTIGSQDSVLPPDLWELYEMYNRLNKPISEDEIHNT